MSAKKQWYVYYPGLSQHCQPQTMCSAHYQGYRYSQGCMIVDAKLKAQ